MGSVLMVALQVLTLFKIWMVNGECIDGGITGAHFVQNVTVNSLMNLYDKSWNEEVVRQVFSVDIVDKILHTPLIAQVQEDRLIWKVERHGWYSVSSAYMLCVDELVDSSHLWRPGYWSGIWKLKVPPKVKNLVWRMCWGCLPTRVRLLDKGVQCPTNCVSCPSHHEDLAHVFFNCPFVVKVWQMTGLWGAIQHALSYTTSATDTIFLLSIEFNQQLSSTFWSIWKHRNLRVWDDVMEVSATVVERAKNLVVDWKFANVPTVADPIPQQRLQPSAREGILAAIGTSTFVTSSSWQHHLLGRYKCNIDATFSSHLNRTGVGICIRDSEGTFVLAKVVSYP